MGEGNSTFTASEDDVVENSHSPSPASSDVLSQHAEALVVQLRERRRAWQERLDLHKAGLETVPERASKERREEAKGELVEWLVSLMETHGYGNWPEYMDAVKLMLYNSFPPLRSSTREQKLTDMIHVLEAHIDMAEKTEVFLGADNLVTLV